MEQESGFDHADLRRITAELRDALCNIRVTGELSRLARRELPDAQLRLNQVLELTETAAHQTLAAVERALPLTEEMAAGVGAFLERWPAGAPGEGEARERAIYRLLGSILTGSDTLRSSLSEVLMAQGFQDITGQIIRRVAGLVAQLEESLSRIGPGEQPAEDQAGMSRENLHRGTGPALPGPAAAAALSDQQDVDDLLARLGV